MAPAPTSSIPEISSSGRIRRDTLHPDPCTSDISPELRFLTVMTFTHLLHTTRRLVTAAPLFPGATVNI
jgi:hypothetical protein